MSHQKEPTPGEWEWYKSGDRWHLSARGGLRPIVLTANAEHVTTVCEACGAEVDCLGPPFLTSRDSESDLLNPLDPNHPDARLIVSAKRLLAACNKAANAIETAVQMGFESNGLVAAHRILCEAIAKTKGTP